MNKKSLQLQGTSTQSFGQNNYLLTKVKSEGDHRFDQHKEPNFNTFEKVSFRPRIHKSLRTLEATVPGFNLTEEEMIKFKIWPNGVIPFYIDDLSFDKAFSDKLRRTLESANSITGLHFVELHKNPTKEDERRWVFFVNRRGVLKCEDYTTNSFTNNGVQHVVVGYDCLGGRNSLAATLLALLGVPPQHNAPNRDEYISVIYENIMPEKHNLFERLKNYQWLFHDVDYDFHSAGHYDRHKFTVNGSATIVYKVDGEDEDRDCFSFKDILKIKMLYNYILRKRKSALGCGLCCKLFKRGQTFENPELWKNNTLKKHVTIKHSTKNTKHKKTCEEFDLWKQTQNCHPDYEDYESTSLLTTKSALKKLFNIYETSIKSKPSTTRKKKENKKTKRRTIEMGGYCRHSP